MDKGLGPVRLGLVGRGGREGATRAFIHFFFLAEVRGSGGSVGGAVGSPRNPLHQLTMARPQTGASPWPSILARAVGTWPGRL